MEPFATPEQMGSRSRGSITSASHPALENELKAATQAIQNVCGWHVAPVESQRFQRSSRIPSVVFLPGMLISAITAVKVNGVTYEPADVEVDYRTGETNLYGRVVDVTFTCGFAEVPADLEALTLDMVAASLGGGAEGLAREQAGAVSVTYREYAQAEVHGKLQAYVLGRIP